MNLGVSAAKAPKVLTVDIGGTKINSALVTFGDKENAENPLLSGSGIPLLSEVLTAPTPAQEGAEAVVAAALDLAAEVLKAADTAPDLVGVASAGVIDASVGKVIAATDALPGWVGTDLAKAFSERFAVPAYVLNDVHAHGFGEARFGAGAGLDSLLLLAIGTGIGGAYIEKGQVLTGVSGAAGHFGHIPAVGIAGAEEVRCSCGRYGHLEGIASGPGIAAELTRRGISAQNTRSVAALANSDKNSASEDDANPVKLDEVLAESNLTPAAAAQQLLAQVGLSTGRAIGAYLNIFDPAVVAITGGVASMDGAAGDTWWEALYRGVKAEAMEVVANTPVVKATAGNYAALLGAGANALERFRQ